MTASENSLESEELFSGEEIKATFEFIRVNPKLFPLPEVVIREKAKPEQIQQIDAKGRQIDTVKYVTFLHLPGKEFALKTYGRGKGIVLHEAETLVRCFQRNHYDLKRHGILVPESYLQTIIKGDPLSDERRIIFIEDFIGDGKNIDDVFKDPRIKNSQKIDLYKRMLEIVKGIPRGASGISEFDLDVIGDWKPANFVQDTDGKLFFVDLFAPKLRDPNDGMVSPYLPKLEDLSRTVVTFLCGDIRGVMARMLGLARRSIPPLEESLTEVTKAVLKNDNPEILRFVEEQVGDKFRMIGELYSLKDEDFFKFEESFDKV